jgi:hypothetical protein
MELHNVRLLLSPRIDGQGYPNIMHVASCACSAPKYELNFGLPHVRRCYIECTPLSDDLPALEREGFTFKRHRRPEWPPEEQRMFVVGLKDIDDGKLVVDKELGLFLSHHVMDGVRSPKECLHALKSMLLQHKRFDLASWCASVL